MSRRTVRRPRAPAPWSAEVVRDAGERRSRVLRRAGGGDPPGPTRDDGPRAQLALRAGRARHPRPRRRHARGLRGQDPCGHRLRLAARGGHPRQGGPAAPAGRAVDRRARGAPTGGAHRRDRRPASAARRRAARARAGDRGVTLARPRSIALVGVTGHVVDVEADLSPGVPSYVLVGLPDASLAESRDRVRAAIVNSQQRWPPTTKRLTVNLSPASLPKRGSGFDLAIAVAVLAADGQVPAGDVDAAVLLGELGLDGRVRPVRGVLPAVLAAARAGVSWVVVPAANEREASLVPGITVTGVRTLGELVALARGEPVPDDMPAALATDESALDPRAGLAGPEPEPLDLADVLGQPAARAVVEVAAAGGPPPLMIGPPGGRQAQPPRRPPGRPPP